MAKKIVDEDGNVYVQKGGCLKKAMGIFIVLIILSALGNMLSNNSTANRSSTSSSDSANKPSVSNVQTTQEPKVTKHKLGDIVTTKDFAIQFVSKSAEKEVHDSTGYLKSTADGMYVIVEINYKNISNSMKTLDSHTFQLFSGDKQYSPSTVLIDKNNVFLDSVNPGIEKKGRLFFDVPADVAAATNLEIRMTQSFFSSGGDAVVELK